MRFGIVAVLVVAALMLMGRDAEAQARGTLQATATVVDTHQGFEALAAVRQVLTDAKIQNKSVAQVSSERPASQPSAVIVTVDFSRN